MLKARSRFVANLLFLQDIAVIALAWLGAYVLRFSDWPVPVYFGVPALRDYLIPLVFVPPVWFVFFGVMGLGRARMHDGRLREAFDLVKATSLTTISLVSADHFFLKLSISRVFLVFFWVFSTLGLILARAGFRVLLLRLRRSGRSLRQTLIIGTGELARQVRSRLELHPELGLRISGYLSPDPGERGRRLDTVEVLGDIGELARVVRAREIDLIIIALPHESHLDLQKILEEIDSELVEVQVVPDLYKYALLRGSVEEFEGLPVIALSGSPMVGWSRVLKRLFDVALGIPLLAVFSPLMAIIALAVKLTSKGPVFYVQERMGFDGRTFSLAKFRTMRVDAEQETGPVWARQDDTRRTHLGTWLRRINLDELPQLWHVVRGQMSLVGPRPERPVFIDKFRDSIPRYMLRHYAKAGMTGWAQVNGWRGNTSVEKRLEHDLYYVRNWSLGLDVKILGLTLLRGFIDKNAY